MSASSSREDQVYCHECGETWARRRHGLECPSCHSDVVEIIEAGNDPRSMHETPLGPDDYDDFDAPDPEEADISLFNLGAPPMERNSNTNRPNSPPRAPPQPTSAHAQDPINFLFEGIMGVMGPMLQGQTQTGHNRPPGGFTTSYTSSQGNGRGFHFVMTSSTTPRTQSPFTQRAFRNLANNRPAVPGRPQMSPDDMGIFTNVVQGMPGAPPFGGAAGVHGDIQDLFGMIFRMLNPGNAASGDYVHSAEEFNRILQQMMEHNTTSTAPGPASDAAIDALPKRAIVKADFGENTTLDCSICMDSVVLGQEVTELPCKHWFHGECVKAWLKEHDTCPQCRRGIMSREGNSDRPRNTGEMPRNWQSNGPRSPMSPNPRSPGPRSPSSSGPRPRNPAPASRTPSSTQPATPISRRSTMPTPGGEPTQNAPSNPAPSTPQRSATQRSATNPPTTRSAQAASLSPRSSEPRPTRQTSYFSSPSTSRVVPQPEPASRSHRPSPNPRQESSSSHREPRSPTSQLRSAGQGLMGWVGRHLGGDNSDSQRQNGNNNRR